MQVAAQLGESYYSAIAGVRVMGIRGPRAKNLLHFFSTGGKGMAAFTYRGFLYQLE